MSFSKLAVRLSRPSRRFNSLPTVATPGGHKWHGHQWRLDGYYYQTGMVGLFFIQLTALDFFEQGHAERQRVSTF